MQKMTLTQRMTEQPVRYAARLAIFPWRQAFSVILLRTGYRALSDPPEIQAARLLTFISCDKVVTTEQPRSKKL